MGEWWPQPGLRSIIGAAACCPKPDFGTSAFWIRRRFWGPIKGRMEARVRIELTYKGFADLSLTTWVPRQLKFCCVLLWLSCVHEPLHSTLLAWTSHCLTATGYPGSKKANA